MSYRTHLTVDSTLRAFFKRSGHIGLGLSAFAPVLALANPTGGQVVAGTATIKNPSANTTVVKQSSQSAIIDWQQFNIGKGQFVQFLQPSSSSIILNRVIGGGGSNIFGSLTGNGQIFLVNTNGMYFGKGASIDAQGFLASTLDIADSDFLAGHYNFDKGSNADAQVVNQGSITAHKGGYVVLAGDYAENDGLISAQSGHIVLASGAKSTLTLNGNSLVSYAVNQATLANLAGANNAGKLQADGGTVIMTADVANLLKATVVNNTGLIEAHAISKDGGTIQLLATGGNIVNAGTIDASATRAGIAGGTITLKGDGRTTLTDASKIVATGDGANGGNVEVSGNTLAMRGAMKIGKGGHLLLDPTSVEIVQGNTSSGAGKGTASDSTFPAVGVSFIENQLNNSVDVAISAHKRIFHGNSVTAITATTGTGKLTLKTGVNGTIDLFTVDVKIAGNLSVSAGYADFGHLQAGNVNIHIGSDVSFAGAVKNSKGVITTQSVLATNGGITIVAPHISSDTEFGTGGFVLKAKDGVDLHGSINIGPSKLSMTGASIQETGNVHAGNLTAVASVGYAQFEGTVRAGNGVSITAANGNIRTGAIDAGAGSVTIKVGGNHSFDVSDAEGGSHGAVGGNKGVNITAENIVFTGSAGSTFKISGGEAGAINIKGHFGHLASVEGGFDHKLIFSRKGISLDNSIIDSHGGVSIRGASLTYTGKGATFSIAASGGDLNLDAAIGTALKPANYGVKLQENVGNMDIERSIFTTKGISAVGTTGTAASGVFVQNSDATAITLSGKGPITIVGKNVQIGDNAPVTIIADDGKATTTTDDLSIQGHRIHIGGFNIASVNDSLAAVTVDHSVTLRAGHDVLISNSGSLQISAAAVQASLGSKGGALTAKGDVSITAGNDINLQAKRLRLIAGKATAEVSGDIKAAAMVTAEANVSLTAGHDVVLQASANSAVEIYAAHAGVTAVTDAAKQIASATASAGVSIKAGHDLTITGRIINIVGGKNAASGAQVIAAQSGAKATAVALADVTISAGDAISVTGKAVEVMGGSGVARAHENIVGPSSNDQVTWSPTQVSATGQKAAASLTATADVSLKAGASGIALTASSGMFVSAGKQAALAAQVDAGSLGGKASLDAEAKLSFAATGNVSLADGANLHVRGGANAGDIAQSFSATFHGISTFSRTVTGSQAARVHAGAGGIANLKTDVSVTITAGGALALADTKLAGAERLTVSAGVRPAGSIEISAAGAKAVTNAVIDTAVSLNAGKGGLTLETDTNSGGTLQIFAGAVGSNARIASHADLSADFGAKAGLAINSGIVLSTKGDLALSARREVEVFGGSDGFHSARVHASSGAATASLQDGVSITAGGVFGAFASSFVGFKGAEHQAQSDSVSAVGTGAKASLSADGRISVTAGGGFNLGAKFFAVSAGRHIGSSADITGSAGGSAALTAKAGVSLVGGGNFTANVGGGNLHIIGGFGGHDDVTAKHGKAALNQDGSVVITVTGNLDLLAPAVTIAAGSGAVGVSDAINVNRGSATLTGLDGIALKAGKEFVASGAASGLSIAGGHSVGAHATLSARGPLSKLVMQTTAGVSIAAGTDVTLKDHGLLFLAVGNDVADHANVNVSSGATLTDSANARLDFTAGGSFLASAHSGALIMAAGFAAGKDDSISVNHGTATFKADVGLHVAAKTSLTLTGDGNGIVETRLETGSHDTFHAVAGAINASVLSDLSLTAGGALHIGMAQGLRIAVGASSSTGDALAARDDLTAQGLGAKINLLANGGVSLSGGTAALDAGGALHLSGGDAAGHQGSIVAGSGAVVSETGLAGIVVKASGAFTAVAGGSLLAAAGGSVGESAVVHARGGKATLTVDAGLTVSALSITLSAGKSLKVTGGVSDGRRDVGSAVGHSGVTETLLAGVNLTASKSILATLTGTGSNHVVSFFGGTNAGSAMSAAADSGAIVSARADAGINLKVTGKGGTVTLSTGTLQTATTLKLDAGSRAAATASVGAGPAASATLTVNSGVNVSALGAVTLAASHGALSIAAGGRDGANGGQAKGKSAKAAMNETASVSIKAGTDLTLSAAGNVTVHVGHGIGLGVAASAGSGGVVTVLLDDHVSLSAGGNLHLGLNSGSLDIQTGDHIGLAGVVQANGAVSKASVSLNGSVSLTAGGALTDTGVAALTIQAGPFPTSSSMLGLGVNSGGKATALLDASVTLKGKSLSLPHNGALVTASSGNVVAGGLTEKGSITVLGGTLTGFAPQALGTLQQGALLMSVEPVLSAPTSYTPTPAAVGGARCEVTLLSDSEHCLVKR